MRATLLLAALLVASAASAAPAHEACAFASRQPRFWQATTRLSALNVSPSGSFFLGDALLRTLQRQLGLAECQVVLTAGEACGAAFAALPCADPVYVCGGELTISDSVYQAAKSGLCSGAAPAPAPAALDAPPAPAAPPPAVCEALAAYPAIQELVAADDCKPVCFAQLQPSTGGAAGARLAPPPAPAAAGGCYTFQLVVDAATQAEVAAAAADLHNMTTAGALLDSLASFAAPGSGLNFIISDSEITTVVGFGFFPPPSPPPSPPPPSPPPPPPSPPPPSPPPPLFPFLPGNDSAADSGADPSVSAQSMDSEGQLVYGQWGPCSADCGEGWQTRTASCLSAEGALLALAQCPGGDAAVTYRACRGPSCSGPYWQYSPWSACNATCGGGTASRTATCEAPAGTACTAGSKQDLERECNTAPCEAYAWRVGAWGECSATCGGGVRTREVICVDATGKPAQVDKCTPGTQPPGTDLHCGLQPCDFCAANDCFGHGYCEDGACVCSPGAGFTGAYCQLPENCTSGVIDAEQQCCPSGLVDAGGACCPAGATLDGVGACCASGAVDACGVCGGSAKWVDLWGACCPTVLDANGMCCQSGALDECGVCDGVGNSCAVQLSLSFEVAPNLVHGDAIEEAPLEALLANLTAALQLPAGALGLDSLSEVAPPTSELAVTSGTRRLAAAAKAAAGTVYLTATVTLDPDATAEADGGAQFSAAWLDAELQQAAAAQPADAPVQLASGSSATRVGVCGNGICEVGERSVQGLLEGTCPQDCATETQTCAAGCGRGTCQPFSGTCECFSGYTGDACQACAPGFFQGANGTCVADVVALALASPAIANPQDGASVTGATDGGGSGTNVGAIVGPIVAVLTLALAAAAFVLHRRRKAFLAFASSQNSPTNSGDVENQFASANDEAALAETRSLREKFGSASSMGGGSMGGSMGPGAAGGNPSLRQSQESMLRSSQEAFKSLHASGAFPAGSLLAAGARTGAGAAPMASATPGPQDTQQLRQSLSSLGRVVSQAGESSSNTSGSANSGGQPASSALDSAQLAAESPAGVAAASLAPHPGTGLSTRPSVLSERPASCGHLAGMMMQSYTSSPIDPQARLFYNPAFNSGPAMSESGTVVSASHVPRPGYALRMPLSARPSQAGDAASEAAEAPANPAARRTQSVNRSLDSLDTRARREKLDRLRAAVEALEADAAQGRLGSGRRAAGPGELESPSCTHQAPPALNVRASVESVCWRGEEDEGAQVSPLALSAGATQRSFLGGRPGVPRLQLNKLKSDGEEAVAAAEEEAEEGYATGAPQALPPARPAVPPLALGSLATVQPARVPAANFSTLDRTQSGRPGVGAHGPAPADPLDDLDSMLGSARKPEASARERITAGINRLLAPLRSARRGPASGDWAAQLSARGTPRSWGASSGMQRTRADSSLQRSVDVELLEDLGPSASETAAALAGAGSPTVSGATMGTASAGGVEQLSAGGGASTITGPSGVARYLNTPRGRLLQTLAAEAAQAQKERSLRDMRSAVPMPPTYTYSGVMGAVDAALQAAQGPSPTRIPRAAPSGTSSARPHYASPSKIPRPTLALDGSAGMDCSDEENAGGYASAQPSPGKDQAAALPRWGGALRASLENLPSRVQL